MKEVALVVPGLENFCFRIEGVLRREYSSFLALRCRSLTRRTGTDAGSLTRSFPAGGVVFGGPESSFYGKREGPTRVCAVFLGPWTLDFLAESV